MATLFKGDNISKYFGGVKALSAVNFEVMHGEILGVIGPNGAGKTTLFNVITGFDSLSSGTLSLDGVDITGKKVHEITKAGFARTFQNIRLFGAMTVLDNLVTGMHINIHTGLFGSLLRHKKFKQEEKQAATKAYEILSYLGIEQFAKETASSLPYGIQRKVEIGRALACDPKIILLDEPSAGMNDQETQECMELIGGIKKLGPSVVVIEHNMQLIMGICERIMVLNFGEKICDGTPEAVQSDQCVIEAYLGNEED
jgi:branched-chain amino acid transport system ATP-binding protein